MSLFEKLSAKSRRRKMQLLRELLCVDEHTSILDVGGEANSHAEQLIERHPWKHNLTVLNVMQQHLDAINLKHSEIVTVHGDARELPFADKSFDLVYSNAVIEHVGTWDDQCAMAREVMRVGRAWFITTPNRWYPFEFHTRLPLVGWLPSHVMKRVAYMWSYNHMARQYRPGNETRTRLLTATELQKLFSDTLVLGVRVTFMAETLVAVGPRSRTNSVAQ